VPSLIKHLSRNKKFRHAINMTKTFISLIPILLLYEDLEQVLHSQRLSAIDCLVAFNNCILIIINERYLIYTCDILYKHNSNTKVSNANNFRGKPYKTSRKSLAKQSTNNTLLAFCLRTNKEMLMLLLCHCHCFRRF